MNTQIDNLNHVTGTFLRQIQSTSSTNPNPEDKIKRIEKWIRYLKRKKSCPSTFPARIGLTEQMHQLQSENRVLFHMTLTYRPYKDRIYRESDIETFFTNFHVRELLPHLLNTRNIHTVSKKRIQPVCLAFLDEHEMNPVPTATRIPLTGVQDNLSTKWEFPVRLHHHAILAVHPENVERFRTLVGTNTLRPFSKKIMTSDLKECDPGRLLYASKMYKKYPEYLCFPDKYHRTRHH